MAGRLSLLLNSVERVLPKGKPVGVFFTSLNWSRPNPYNQNNVSEPPTSSANRINLLFGAGFGLAVGFLLNTGYNDFKRDNINANFNHSHSSNKTSEKFPPASPRDTCNFVADVAEKVVPSVVYIESVSRHPLLGNKLVPTSNGSGFIVRSDGLVLTNAHVVSHSVKVVVKLHDGQSFDGIVENIDPETDLATVRINAVNLPVLPLGQSSDIRHGEFVVAFGNPFTLMHSATAGIVSSRHRPSGELGLKKGSDYIQTDAAIYSGNSGGPLVNLNGEAIGINAMTVTQGISFAIPSDRAAEFLKKTEVKHEGWWPFNKTTEKTDNKKRYIGITMLTLSAPIIEELQRRNMEFPAVTHGVLIWRVILGSPAYETGMRAGDVIVRINNAVIHSSADVYKMLAREKSLVIEVARGNTILKFHVTPEIAS